MWNDRGSSPCLLPFLSGSARVLITLCEDDCCFLFNNLLFAILCLLPKHLTTRREMCTSMADLQYQNIFQLMVIKFHHFFKSTVATTWYSITFLLSGDRKIKNKQKSVTIQNSIQKPVSYFQYINIMCEHEINDPPIKDVLHSSLHFLADLFQKKNKAKKGLDALL
jgi:hypothetical protein